MGTRKLSFRLLLALTCAGAILLLAVACSSATPKPTATVEAQPTATALPTPTMEPTATPIPTANPTPTPTPAATPTPTPLPTATTTPTPEAYACEYDNTEERRRSVRNKYQDLFESHPFLITYGVERFVTGPRTTRVGITVEVAIAVPNDLLSPNLRIPECLEGIPVHVKEGLGFSFPGEAPDTRKTEIVNIEGGGQATLDLTHYLKCSYRFYVGQDETVKGEETIEFRGERHMETGGTFLGIYGDGEVFILSNAHDSNTPKRVFVYLTCWDDPRLSTPVPSPTPSPAPWPTSTPTPPRPVTLEEYIATVCIPVDERVTIERWGDFAEIVAPMVELRRSVRPPDDMLAYHGALIALWEAMVELAKNIDPDLELHESKAIFSAYPPYQAANEAYGVERQALPKETRATLDEAWCL